MSKETKHSRQEQKAITRQKIKEAVEQLIDSQAIANTKIGDITKAAGIASGTFYVHFESKEEVLKEIFADFNTKVYEKIRPTIEAASEQPLEYTIETIAKVFLDFWLQNQGIVKIYAQIMQDNVELDGLKNGVTPMAIQMLSLALSNKAKATKTPPRNWELIAHAIASIWLRIGLQYLFGSGVTRADAVDTLTQLTLGSVNAVLNSDR